MNVLTVRTRAIFLILVLSTFIVAVFPASAELVFSAPPRESPEDGDKTYGPLVNYLSTILGEKVVYKHPGGWARYANEMRDGHYDIVFDGPHFSAWRIKNIQHQAVARLPGSLGFVVVTHKDSNRVQKVRDLLGVEICALASPNLGTVTVYNLFDNPVNSPRIYEIKNGFNGIYEAFKKGQCDAAVLRDNFYYKLDPKEKSQLKVVTASLPAPNQTFTISKRLFEKRQLIATKLVSVDGKKATENIRKRFGGFEEGLLITDSTEFQGLDKLLSDVLWGW